MQTKFKRHQAVKIIRLPDPDRIEWYADEQPLQKGMKGTINILLPNGQYHVLLNDKAGNVLCYAPFNEEDIELA
ncbi:hypothetical protein FJZ22_01925 [Candidatus Pacearchaeota archaeon]|nr:hypothetical protein [Candidatus Pacearchaeota archaeon]